MAFCPLSFRDHVGCLYLSLYLLPSVCPSLSHATIVLFFACLKVNLEAESRKHMLFFSNPGKLQHYCCSLFLHNLGFSKTRRHFSL
eukprot:m.12190 g.12190  ORF g.12190 m.12190 type:complete len:86 (+) comp6783_c0_seq1:1953-2210(+)